MPLTNFQRAVLAVIAPNRAPDSYLAGGSALHFAPESVRYSHALDVFHDLESGVAEAFAADTVLLRGAGYEVETVLSQPGFIRAVVSMDVRSTQIDWAHDSAWRFMPAVRDELGGYLLHPIDLATNKALALAGRDEPRDFVDVLFILDTMLPLGPLVWAAVAKDPGYNPLSLLEQLRRRGKVRPEEISRLDLSQPFDMATRRRRSLAHVAPAPQSDPLRRHADAVVFRSSTLEHGRKSPQANAAVGDQARARQSSARSPLMDREQDAAPYAPAQPPATPPQRSRARPVPSCPTRS